MGGRRANKTDSLLIIDVEATCWDGKHDYHAQPSEIIEIGIVEVDLKTLTKKCKRSIIIEPEYSKVSPFCTELTTLTQEDVKQGVTFAQACEILLREFDSFHKPWLSYGDYDRSQFGRECTLHGVPYPFGKRHLNFKSLFAMGLGLQREIGLHRALDMMGLEFEGTAHRGDDDAWNIARLVDIYFCRIRGGVPPNIPRGGALTGELIE